MTSRCFLAVAVLMIALGSPSVSAAEDETSEFSAALAAYFSLAPEEISEIWDAGISAEEIAVIIRIAQIGDTSPARLGTMRARGDSFRDIMVVRNLGADAFYIPFGIKNESRVFNPIFEKFGAVPESEYGSVQLSDDEIVNLVNLKFLSSHYDYSAIEIMRMRDAGRTFLSIQSEVKAAKEKMAVEERAREIEEARKESG